jgi:hypothetical protein
MVIQGTSSFKMRLLTFILNALWEKACCIENGSSFHSFGPEYVKVFLKSSVFAFGRNEAPVYLKNKIQYLSDKNPYSLRNVVSKKLKIPKAKTELFKKTFTYSGPKLWNELLFLIRQASSYNAFKTNVKSHFKWWDFYQTSIGTSISVGIGKV